MFEKFNNWWNQYGFELLLCISIIIIIITALCRIGKRGTWAKTDIHYNPRPSLVVKKKRIVKESSGETECRRVLRYLFNKPFNNQRPDFLRNPVTGGLYNLELDCYDPDLKLAVEYNGVQHYKYVPFFHKNKEAFLNQKYRDDMKRRMCRDNNIILIEVPNTVKVNNIHSFLVGELKKYNFRV